MHQDRGLPASGADGVRAARRTIAEVRRILLADWDPIGIGDNPNLNDEYDDVLGHVMSALATAPSVEDMTATLQHMTEDLLGTIPEPASCHVAAVRLVALRQATPDWPTSSASIKQEVMAWVAAQLDTAPEMINMTTRLGEDLGLDGDEASDFIEAFGHEFDVDLSSLYSGWRRHFGPEGVPLSAGLIAHTSSGSPPLR